MTDDNKTTVKKVKSDAPNKVVKKKETKKAAPKTQDLSFQDRVIAEEKELATKINDLRKFLEDAITKGVPDAETNILHTQLTFMGHYHTILCTRIKRFK